MHEKFLIARGGGQTSQREGREQLSYVGSPSAFLGELNHDAIDAAAVQLTVGPFHHGPKPQAFAPQILECGVKGMPQRLAHDGANNRCHGD
jgi:hypothetical protein